ncbi:guanine nucleotide binding protein, alpha subunit [Mucidula mucida]|nr:guanine nucleotide binding protein, alpha subunit [Mucidula mucida]
MAVTAHPRSSTESASSDDSDDSGSSNRVVNPRSGSPLKFKEKHRLLKQRLWPLRRIQADLERTLGNAAIELNSTDIMTAAPFAEKKAHEFSIHATNGWKSAFDKLKSLRGRPDLGSSLQEMRDAENDILDIVSGCRDDMATLWMDPTVREMLGRRKQRIEDSPGFFLDDVERIAVPDYTPTDDDIIRSRLRTLGVQEYRFVFDHGRTVGQEWRLYDVGGTRSSRAAWYPYFDDVDAIIFLAPISCFDEKLAEGLFPLHSPGVFLLIRSDRRVNRLEDSYMLWKSVISCKLLSRTQIILFLNKCDLLQNKLSRGVKIRDYVPSFSDRANTLSMATKYFQQHFREILKQNSPVQRPFYVHLTSVIDTRSTAVTLGAVEESILRDHLRRADLM